MIFKHRKGELSFWKRFFVWKPTGYWMLGLQGTRGGYTILLSFRRSSAEQNRDVRYFPLSESSYMHAYSVE